MTQLVLPTAQISVAHAEASTTLSPAHVRCLLLGLGFATGMEFYTVDSVNLVLPDLTGTLGVSADEASWLLTTYSSTLFLGVPVSIWLAGHVGYKRFLIATILLFAIASIGCALSPDLGTMLVFRAIQGAAGAGLVVWWRASIYLLLPKPQRSPSLMRVSTMLYLSSAGGLLASGYLTDHASWRLIFVPDLFYAAMAICLLLRYFPTLPKPAQSSAATDWLGIALIALALISLQVILSRGQIDDWFGSPLIRLLAWASAACFVLFVLWQSSRRNRAPLLHLDLLGDRNVMSAALIGVFTGVILSGSLYVLPEFLRKIATHSLSATQTGQVICVYALAAAAVRPLMVGFVARVGQRKAICAALVILIASMLLFERLLTADTPASAFYMPLVLYALCLAPLLPAVGSGTVARIEQRKLLDGVSLYMTFRQFGASLGVALLTILIDRRETLHSGRLVEHLHDGSTTTQSWRAAAAMILRTRGGFSAWEGQHRAVKLLAESAARQAATLAYADAFLFMAAIGVVALCLVPIIPPTPVAPKP
jgi:MFS transporter, DHA2 family, multidrug resistance protein